MVCFFLINRLVLEAEMYRLCLYRLYLPIYGGGGRKQLSANHECWSSSCDKSHLPLLTYSRQIMCLLYSHSVLTFQTKTGFHHNSMTHAFNSPSGSTKLQLSAGIIKRVESSQFADRKSSFMVASSN